MKIYIESMGCDSNIADSNKVKKFLKNSGAKIVSDYHNADFIILMSCGFNQIILKDNIKRLNELKKTGAKLILGGCVPKIDPTVCKLVNYSFGPKELARLKEIFQFNQDIEGISPEFKREDRKIIRISTGCEGRCTYCAIKIANGRTKSRTIEMILQDVKEGIKEGYSKFVFTSEDNGSWGQDINSDITKLIKAINKVEGNFRITLTTFNPQWFVKYPELYKLLKSGKIEKKIYLPLQSGSNRILKLMRRGYSVEQYLKIFGKIKKKIPDMKIQVDVLIGFPTETKEDFEKTLDLVRKLDIYLLQVFAYTDMKRTVAENLEPKIPFEKINKRAKKIIDLFIKKHKGEKRNLVNTNLKIKECD